MLDLFELYSVPRFSIKWGFTVGNRSHIQQYNEGAMYVIYVLSCVLL